MTEATPQFKRPSLAFTLYVRGGARAVEFYKNAFGAVELFRHDGEDGSVIAQLGIGDRDFWVTDESVEFKNFSPDSLSGGTVNMVLTVDDPHAVFDRAVAAGAKVVCPVRDERYGWRIGKLEDPFGHKWEIGKPLP